MVNLPEHRFTENQIAELIKLLGTHPAKLPKLRNETLPDAARWFTSELAQQNYPPHSQIIKSLEKIENATSRLRSYLLNQLARPYLRMAAGDVVEDDRRLDAAVVAVENLKGWSQKACEIVKRNEERARRNEAERNAIGNAIAEANAQGERKASPEAIAQAIGKAKAEYTPRRKAKGKPKGAAKRTAMRVLVHRLALLWLRTHGTRPTVSVKNNHASGKFIRFAQFYIQAMREQTTKEHREFAQSQKFKKTIDEELNVSADVIAEHWKIFDARLKPRP